MQQGTTTLMVSLPAKWVQRHHLQKGSDVTIEYNDRTLLVSAGETNMKSEIAVSLPTITESSIRTLITNTYRSGYDIIRVDFKSEEQYKILQKIIRELLIGFEVIKKEKNYCIVENVTEPAAEQFDAIIKKIFFSIQELFEIIEKRFIDSKLDVEEVEGRIQRYDNFCRRVIAKQKLSFPKSEFWWGFLTLLNHGQRELYLLHKQIKSTVSLRARKLLRYDLEIFELLRKAYFENNISYLGRLHELEKEAFYREGYEALAEIKGKENILVYHLLASIRQFYQANSPLTGLLYG